MGDLESLTATEALECMRSGGLSAEALARACLARVEARDQLVHAWTHVDPNQVMAAARAGDGQVAKGPLSGVPIGIKDVILTRDMPTQYNSPIYQGFSPGIDAACVMILRAAGALIFGKTDTVEFAATGRRALTCNPHDLERTPGGSSSGSAAAVADRHVPIALGTQTAGSIVRPASFCGVFGMKPTWNLVSNEGAKMFSPTLDTIGWYARSAEDLALVYDVFDPEPTAEAVLDIAEARIAICRTPVWDQAGPATRTALADAVELLRKAGATVIDLELPSPFERLPELQTLIMRAEARGTFLSEYRAHYDLLGASFREQVENIDDYTRDQLRAAYDVAAQCRAVFDDIAAGYDAVLAPSTVGEATVGLESTGSYVFNGLWTLLQAPCINVPGFTGPNGLPVGLTVTGPRFADRKVLAASAALGRLFAGGGRSHEGQFN
jgi:Asp-tRNA(Asn)/Glu-tRNA(Gln) amidotransferase A subunit family amidase